MLSLAAALSLRVSLVPMSMMTFVWWDRMADPCPLHAGRRPTHFLSHFSSLWGGVGRQAPSWSPFRQRQRQCSHHTSPNHRGGGVRCGCWVATTFCVCLVCVSKNSPPPTPGRQAVMLWLKGLCFSPSSPVFEIFNNPSLVTVGSEAARTGGYADITTTLLGW
jgi:hypothetical protein